ncbi:MAG: tRNA (N6-isopentenyl adenosine(37)-C2)-methylthiotransferase MiaB [Clostridia bacterium]|nr:tRNA (N6-isopentenyl adenosine(37)-C2)-methylthiotransferase MiaB [Clostridia bacterium]
MTEQEDFINKVKNRFNNIRNHKFYIYTMGCELNENDSEKISGMLTKMGYLETDNKEDADIIIFNTCCVRDNEEDRLFGKIGDIKKIKKDKDVILAIGGCMMQEKAMLQKIKNSYNYVDIIFGTHTMQKLPEYIFRVLEEKVKVKDVIDIDGKIYEGIPIKRKDKYRASVAITYGCNNFCTFCIVPYVRGRERDRNPEKIIDEVKSLAKDGYKEITLLGQNVNSYMNHYNTDKSKFGKINSFATLLDEICKIDGIERVKFLSPHPKDFTDDVIDVIAKNDKVSRLIHMPLQSGNTKVLKEMNRKYTKENYLELIDKMKNKIPNSEFSTDIIVGFPGETEEEFEDTLDVVRKVNFEQIFMFIYSPRQGTVAAKRDDQIPGNIKHIRFNKLKELYESQIDENNKKYIGTKQKILIEGLSKNNKNMFTGRTNTNKVVIFEKKEGLTIGESVAVKITEAHKWFLKGTIL